MGLSILLKNQMLNAIRGVAPSLYITHVSLHMDSPGETGENEIGGGSPAYVRQPIIIGNPANAMVGGTNQPVFDVPAGATIRYVGYWSAVSGGTFCGYAAINEFTAASQAKFRLNSQSFDLSGTGLRQVFPVALSGEEAIGIVALTQMFVAVGIGSSEAVGIPVQFAGLIVEGIGSEEALDAPTIQIFFTAASVVSAEAFGNTIAATWLILSAIGIDGAEALGAANLQVILAASGIGGAEAFGAFAIREQGGNPVAVSDNFDRANENTLGANWLTLYQHDGGAVSNNLAAYNTVGSNVRLGVRWNGTETFNNNQYAECMIIYNVGTLVTYLEGVGPIVRASSGNPGQFYVGLYWHVYDWDTYEYTHNYRIYKFNNDTWTALGAPYTIVNSSPTVPIPIVRIEVSGADLTLKTAGAHGGPYTVRCTASDASYASGKPGFRFYGNTANTCWRVNDWYGGDL